MDENPYQSPNQISRPERNGRWLREIFDAALLGASMLAGGIVAAFVLINPLAHGEHVLEFNAAVFFGGMAVGAAIRKVYQYHTKTNQ